MNQKREVDNHVGLFSGNYHGDGDPRAHLFGVAVAPFIGREGCQCWTSRHLFGNILRVLPLLHCDGILGDQAGITLTRLHGGTVPYHVGIDVLAKGQGFALVGRQELDRDLMGGRYL